jgi:hypothetical protein
MYICMDYCFALRSEQYIYIEIILKLSRLTYVILFMKYAKQAIHL